MHCFSTTAPANAISASVTVKGFLRAATPDTAAVRAPARPSSFTTPVGGSQPLYGSVGCQPNSAGGDGNGNGYSESNGSGGYGGYSGANGGYGNYGQSNGCSANNTGGGCGGSGYYSYGCSFGCYYKGSGGGGGGYVAGGGGGGGYYDSNSYGGGGGGGSSAVLNGATGTGTGSNSGNGSVSITYTIGAVASVSPDGQSFGWATTGSSQSKTFTLTNTSADTPLNTLALSASGAYSIPALTGTGEYPPNISVESAQDFGTVTTGQTQDETITVTNTGDDGLILGSLSIDGANPDQFSIVAGQDTAQIRDWRATRPARLRCSFRPATTRACPPHWRFPIPPRPCTR